MGQAQDDQAVTRSHPSDANDRLELMHLEAIKRLHHAYEDAYRLGNLPLRVINHEVKDPNNPITRDEYIYELMTIARWMANFAIELGIISVQDHNDIRRDFFIRHPEFYDKEWHPKREKRPARQRASRDDSSVQ